MRKHEDLVYQYLVNNDNEAYSSLMNDNYDFVTKSVEEVLKENNINLDHIEEYLGSGYIGFSNAINRYDLSHSTKLSFLEYAKRHIKEEVVKGLYRENKKSINNESKLGYIDHKSSKIILETIACFDPKQRKIMDLFYGTDGKKPLTAKKISRLLGVSRQAVSVIKVRCLNLIADNLKENGCKYDASKIFSVPEKNKGSFYSREKIDDIPDTLNDFYRVYGENIIQSALKTLSEDEVKIISEYNKDGLEANENFSNYSNMNKKEIIDKIFSINKKIVFYCQSYVFESQRRKILTDLYSLSSKEEVDKTIKKLENPYREILEYYYGLNGKKERTVEELAKKFNINSDSVYRKIVKGRSLLKKELNLGSKISNNTPRKILQAFIDKYGIESFEQIIENQKHPNTREVIELCCGLNGKVKMSIENISKWLGIKQSCIYKIIIDVSDEARNKFKEDIFNKNDIDLLYFRFGKENVENTLKKARKSEYRILERFYGLNGNKASSIEEISNELNLTVLSIYAVISSFVKELNSDQNYNDIKELYRLITTLGKDKILAIKDIFDIEDQQILSDLIDVIDKNESLKLLKKKYFITEKKLYSRLNYIYNKLNNTIRQIANIHSIYSLYDTDLIDNIISNLNEMNKNILNDVLNNIDFKLISLKYNVYEEYIYHLLSVKFLKQLENKKNFETMTKSNNPIRILINKYGKRNVYYAVNTLEKEEIEIFKSIYSDLYEKQTVINMNLSEKKQFGEIIKKLRSKLTIIEENKIEMKDIWNDLVSRYGLLKVKNNISSINDTSIKIVNLFFGLDGNKPMSIDDISNEYMITKSAIRGHIGSFYSYMVTLIENKDKDSKTNIISLINRDDNYIKSKVENSNISIEIIIKNYYGIDTPKLTIKEIAQKYRLGTNKVANVINEIEEYAKSNCYCKK